MLKAQIIMVLVLVPAHCVMDLKLLKTAQTAMSPTSFLTTNFYLVVDSEWAFQTRKSQLGVHTQKPQI